MYYHLDGDKICPAHIGAMTVAIFHCNESEIAIAARFNCSEETVQSVRARYEKVEKMGIDPLTNEAWDSSKPVAISPQEKRRLIREATKDQVQMRKDWVEVAQEIGIDATEEAIERAFSEAGYRRVKGVKKGEKNKVRFTVKEGEEMGGEPIVERKKREKAEFNRLRTAQS
ncbi:MAG: hypothetical protein Q9225_005424 [Loekoesia sp. 1 TL-2023]